METKNKLPKTEKGSAPSTKQRATGQCSACRCSPTLEMVLNA